jgi:hypothetical protein
MMQSTRSETTLTTSLALKEGDLVSITRSDGSVEIGEVLRSDEHPGTVSFRKLRETLPRNRKMVAHRQMGHSFWPRRNLSPHRYECCHCGMEKPPGVKPDMDCQNYLRYKVVQEVHER